MEIYYEIPAHLFTKILANKRFIVIIGIDKQTYIIRALQKEQNKYVYIPL